MIIETYWIIEKNMIWPFVYFNKYIDTQKNKISFHITDKGKLAPILEKYPVKASIGNNKKKKLRMRLPKKIV